MAPGGGKTLAGGIPTGAGGAAVEVVVVVVVIVDEAVSSEGFLPPRREYIAAVTAAPPPALRQAIMAMDLDILTRGAVAVAMLLNEPDSVRRE
jgi:hypothetical protein